MGLHRREVPYHSSLEARVARILFEPRVAAMRRGSVPDYWQYPSRNEKSFALEAAGFIMTGFPVGRQPLLLTLKV